MSLIDLINAMGVENSGLTAGRFPNTDVERVSVIVPKSSAVLFGKKLIPVGFVDQKLDAAALASKDNPEYAFYLLKSAAAFAPDASKIYMLLAEIAAESKAWSTALKAHETAKWLESVSNAKSNLTAHRLKTSLFRIRDSSSEVSDSMPGGNFWEDKAPDRFWILERIYYKGQENRLVDLIFGLLEHVPYAPENYFAAYKGLSLLGSPALFERYAAAVRLNLGDEQIEKNNFLGLAKSKTLDFLGAIECFQLVLKSSPQNLDALNGLALASLRLGDIDTFINTGEKIMACPPMRDASYAAICFVFSCLKGKRLPNVSLPDHVDISRNIAEIISGLVESGQAEIALKLEDNLSQLGYFIGLPFLPVCIAEIYVEKRLYSRALVVLQGTTGPEAHRIRARIFRSEMKNELAEKELLEYRKTQAHSSEIVCQILNLKVSDLSQINSEQKILTCINDMYRQTDTFINSLELEYGISGLTCKAKGCQDCCKKTFPVVSFSEYLNIRHWLQGQSEEFRTRVEMESRQMTDLYAHERGHLAPFLSEYEGVKEAYPVGLSFHCPFLGKNSCLIYDVRPFGCRCYGYASYNGVTINACNYFYRQFEVASTLSPVRKVIGAVSFYRYAALCDKNLLGRVAVAPLPVWFAQSHEQVLEKVSQDRL